MITEGEKPETTIALQSKQLIYNIKLIGIHVYFFQYLPKKNLHEKLIVLATCFPT